MRVTQSYCSYPELLALTRVTGLSRSYWEFLDLPRVTESYWELVELLGVAGGYWSYSELLGLTGVTQS